MAGHMHQERRLQRRALVASLAANSAFVVAEFAAAIAFNSLALLADAAHMLSDVSGLGIALLAQGLLARPPTVRHTYGLQRAEVLGALVSGVLLVAAAVYVFVEAAERLRHPAPVAGLGLLIVAALGLAVNAGSALLLARAQGHSLNMRAAHLHMLLDALGSIGAIIAGAAVVMFGAYWVDPLASVLIGLLVLWSATQLLRETAHVLLEGVPRHVNAEEVERTLANQPGVEQVHHLHIWSLASDVPALSAHVVVGENYDLHEAQKRREALKDLLEERFGIAHATLEMECHACDGEQPTSAPRASEG